MNSTIHNTILPLQTRAVTPAQKPIGIGMIGCCGMGMILVKNLLKGRPDLKVVALCDPREWAINETHKTIEPTAKVYADYRDLVNAPEVDFVMIASWNYAHAERRMHIVGSEGTIRAGVIQGIIQLQRIGWDTRIEDVSSDASGGHGGGDPIIARELYDCIVFRTPATSSPSGLLVTANPTPSARTGSLSLADPEQGRSGCRSGICGETFPH